MSRREMVSLAAFVDAMAERWIDDYNAHGLAGQLQAAAALLRGIAGQLPEDEQ